MKTFDTRLIEVGWTLPADSIGHLVMDEFPASMDNIADVITHTGKEITLDNVLDHLRLHAHNIESRAVGSGTKNDPITLFTDSSKKCQKNAHNTLAPHSESNCWMLHPELRPAKGSNNKTESTNSKN
ncbi:hypothetical protein PGT21_011794 [Puccinia graminis f. sp. tritici]|uniref:Uncharacterized protein n=1 Tax=Puccinia graminis f. sp. tritici TaxID=56615 RepID=A0A5B0MAY6_PUCGR|nr:hypothetical protein PGT21_011794 [Puccinia graminis f. sp. tritici]